eukprot:CAMPEP_0115008400 /NCGR_PEP_ID=MMETSP0216-20121206/21897_1 /TAXON_ID=223996 /ORGANISM="Protocruzia adherens, Strain Boccale" /LENGTH=1045 /DNA_ID=CAMNT_0002375815 /DNA_START=72 /DNA_END=3206 /DNA_ORIENTATION=-
MTMARIYLSFLFTVCLLVTLTCAQQLNQTELNFEYVSVPSEFQVISAAKSSSDVEMFNLSIQGQQSLLVVNPETTSIKQNVQLVNSNGEQVNIGPIVGEPNTSLVYALAEDPKDQTSTVLLVINISDSEDWKVAKMFTLQPTCDSPRSGLNLTASLEYFEEFKLIYRSKSCYRPAEIAISQQKGDYSATLSTVKPEVDNLKQLKDVVSVSSMASSSILATLYIQSSSGWLLRTSSISFGSPTVGVATVSLAEEFGGEILEIDEDSVTFSLYVIGDWVDIQIYTVSPVLSQQNDGEFQGTSRIFESNSFTSTSSHMYSCLNGYLFVNEQTVIWKPSSKGYGWSGKIQSHWLKDLQVMEASCDAETKIITLNVITQRIIRILHLNSQGELLDGEGWIMFAGLTASPGVSGPQPYSIDGSMTKAITHVSALELASGIVGIHSSAVTGFKNNTLTFNSPLFQNSPNSVQLFQEADRTLLLSTTLPDDMFDNMENLVIASLFSNFEIHQEKGEWQISGKPTVPYTGMLELSASPAGNPEFQYPLYIPYYTASRTGSYTALVKACYPASETDWSESFLQLQDMKFDSAGYLTYSVYNPAYNCHAVGSFRPDGTLGWIQTAVGNETRLIPDIGFPRAVITSTVQDRPGVYAIYSDFGIWVPLMTLPNNNIHQIVQSESYIFFIDTSEIIRIDKKTFVTKSYSVPLSVVRLAPPNVNLVYSDGEFLSYYIVSSVDEYASESYLINVNLKDPSKASLLSLNEGVIPVAQSSSTYVFTQLVEGPAMAITTVTFNGTSIYEISAVQCPVWIGSDQIVRLSNDSIFFASDPYFGLISNNTTQWVNQVNTDNNCTIVTIDVHDNMLALAVSCGIKNTPPNKVTNYIVSVTLQGSWSGPQNIISTTYLPYHQCSDMSSSPLPFMARELKIGEGMVMDVMLPDGLMRGPEVSGSESAAAEVAGSYLLQQGVVGPVPMCDGGGDMGTGGSVTLDLNDVEGLRMDCEFTGVIGVDMPDGVSWSGSPLPARSIVLDTCLSKWDGKETMILEVDLPVICSYAAW